MTDARMRPHPPRALPAVLLALAAALLLVALVRTAWICDDAFITFRSVENLVQGHGARWNVDERVQTYTHPLWFLLLCGARTLTGELLLTSQWLGIALAFGAALWCAATTGGAAAAAALLLAACASSTWLQSGTSGLEAPLVYALLAALGAALRTAEPRRRLRRVALVGALLATTRYDLLLVAAPVLLASLRGVPARAAIAAVAAGMLPLAAWVAFATVYYGTPFPITAYAKLFAPGVPAWDLVEQGLCYLGRTAAADPFCVVMLVAGVAAGLRHGGDARWLAVGTLLYCAYVVKVGGDYMLGRFWAPPFALALALWFRTAPAGAAGRRAALAAAAAVPLALFSGDGLLPRWLAPHPTTPAPYDLSQRGITDEHRYGHFGHGLTSPARIRPRAGEFADALGERVRGRFHVVYGAVGHLGFAAGPRVHVTDPWLCDPLLMRLPVADPAHWRIGHFMRRFPRGHLESIVRGENRIASPMLAPMFDAVRAATRAPVWSAGRWASLWALWTGRFDADLAAFVAGEYRAPPRDALPLAALAAPLPAGAEWFEARDGRTPQAGGLELLLPAAGNAAAVDLDLTLDTTWRLSFRRQDRTVGEALVTPAGASPDRSLHRRRVAVPDEARPFDAIWVDVELDLTRPAAAWLARVALVD